MKLRYPAMPDGGDPDSRYDWLGRPKQFTVQDMYDFAKATFRYNVELGIDAQRIHDSSVHRVKMLYPEAGKGDRILPSIYTGLRSTWLRASGLRVDPAEMNPYHRDASRKLLKESHGNLIGKCTDLLGRMANHFGNQPEIVDRLAELCLMMQRVEVNEVYPIFDLLTEVERGSEIQMNLGNWELPC